MHYFELGGESGRYWYEERRGQRAREERRVVGIQANARRNRGPPRPVHLPTRTHHCTANQLAPKINPWLDMSSEYLPPLAISSSCDPLSTTCPSSITTTAAAS
jgi:hypothetical protein